MSGFVSLLDFAVGTLVGGIATGLVMWWRMRPLRSAIEHVDREGSGRLEQDRVVISEEFTAHAVAVRKQVSEYADMLAGEDPILRERLRQIETGSQPC